MTTVQTSFTMLGALVVLALAFSFLKGFRDVANSIATIVSTGALKPYQAVAWAALWNFAALFLFHTHVAATVALGIVDPAIVDHHVVLGALTGATAWSVLTWVARIPSSWTHALVGGLIGATLARADAQALIWPGVLKVGAFIVLAPAFAFVIGGLLMLGASWVFFKATPRRLEGWFRKNQLLSSAMYNLGHGGNDAQKTIGAIWLLLIVAGVSSTADAAPPAWVAPACYASLALGTLFGGWRIVKTMGQRITKLRPVGGFCAETSGAITLFVASWLGIPVSTMHTITGAIVGVGSSRKFSAVRWGLAGTIVWAWILTIPASAALAALAWWIGRHLL